MLKQNRCGFSDVLNLNSEEINNENVTRFGGDVFAIQKRTEKLSVVFVCGNPFFCFLSVNNKSFANRLNAARNKVFISCAQLAGFPEKIKEFALRVGHPLPRAAGTRIRDQLQARRQLRAPKPESLSEEALEPAASHRSANLRAAPHDRSD